jgi:hypothetical protein
MNFMSQAHDEAFRIAVLEASNLEHISRWQIQKSAYDGALLRISGKIRHIEQKINTLDDAEAADVAAECLKTS